MSSWRASSAPLELGVHAHDHGAVPAVRVLIGVEMNGRPQPARM
jgi:hypothetical protein